MHPFWSLPLAQGSAVCPAMASQGPLVGHFPYSAQSWGLEGEGLEWIHLLSASGRVHSRSHPSLFQAHTWLICLLALKVGIKG